MTYLTSREAADLLRISERKLYELVADGAVPCSKVTGRWLFPRAALDHWVMSGLIASPGSSQSEPPPIIGGSHDPLLEWAVRQSQSGLALLPEGSDMGLQRLAANEVMLAGIHLHTSGDDDGANAAAVAARPGLEDAVVIAFARREQGLVCAAGNPLGLTSLDDALARRARVGLRQPGAGAQQLMDVLLLRAGPEDRARVDGGRRYPTGHDLCFAIRAGDIDCGVASRSVADAGSLAFVPLMWERFDLVLRRRSYFEPPAQALFALMRQPAFQDHARRLGGYDTATAGTVRFNR